MKSMLTYIAFYGKTEEALAFYKDVFGGEIVAVMKFDSAPMPIPDDYKQKVMHAEFKSGVIHFYASDGMPGMQAVASSNVSLSLEFEDEAFLNTVYEKLGSGGSITMPLQDTFWGAKFGTLTDKYGVQWMLNLPTESDTEYPNS